MVSEAVGSWNDCEMVAVGCLIGGDKEIRISQKCGKKAWLWLDLKVGSPEIPKIDDVLLRIKSGKADGCR